MSTNPHYRHHSLERHTLSISKAGPIVTRHNQRKPTVCLRVPLGAGHSVGLDQCRTCVHHYSVTALTPSVLCLFMPHHLTPDSHCGPVGPACPECHAAGVTACAPSDQSLHWVMCIYVSSLYFHGLKSPIFLALNKFHCSDASVYLRWILRFTVSTKWNIYVCQNFPLFSWMFVSYLTMMLIWYW